MYKVDYPLSLEQRVITPLDMSNLLTFICSSQLSYGTTFRGNSSSSDKAFLMQKRNVRLINAAYFRDTVHVQDTLEI